jgi:hypothetical protein
MREAKREAQLVRALSLGAVTDADDVEFLHETTRDTLHHVGDERAGEAVQRTVFAFVVRTLDEKVGLVFAHGDFARDDTRERALRAFHRDGAVGDGDVDS